MVDLYGDESAFAVDCFCQLVELRHEHVMVESELACSVGACREVYADVLYDDEACAPFGSELVVIDVIIVDAAIRISVVGAHRGHNYSVFENSFSDCDRLKNLWVIFLHVLIPPSVVILSYGTYMINK